MKKEIEIEVFRADDRASRGITSADIAELAASYDAEAFPAPAVIGHPKSDSPAHGIIAGFRAEGNKLFAKLTDIKDDLIDKVKSGELINRSMAFFGPDHEANPTPGKLAARHLGFLGGSAPGIPGMSNLRKAFSFSAGDDELVIDGPPAEAIIFTAAPTPVRNVNEEPEKEPSPMADKNDDKSAEFEAREAEIKAREEAAEAREKAAAEREKEFAAQAETSRKAANKVRVDGLVASGRVLPANRDALEKVFNALDTGELEFAADDKGSAADKLVSIMSSGPKLVDDSGKPLSPSTEREFSAGKDHQATARKITARANELRNDDASLTFEAAVEIAQKEMEG